LRELLDSRDRRARAHRSIARTFADEVFYLPGNADPHVTGPEDAADE